MYRKHVIVLFLHMMPSSIYAPSEKCHWKCFWPNITLFWETTSFINHRYLDTSQNILQLSKERPPCSSDPKNQLLGKKLHINHKCIWTSMHVASFSGRSLTQPTSWTCSVREGNWEYPVIAKQTGFQRSPYDCLIGLSHFNIFKSKPNPQNMFYTQSFICQ